MIKVQFRDQACRGPLAVPQGRCVSSFPQQLISRRHLWCSPTPYCMKLRTTFEGIWACCSTKIGTSSMQSSTGMPRPWSLGSIFSRYRDLECANSVQLLIRLQQAILQPCSSYACEVWAPAAAVAGPLKELQAAVAALFPASSLPGWEECASGGDVSGVAPGALAWLLVASRPSVLDGSSYCWLHQHPQPCLSWLPRLGC